MPKFLKYLSYIVLGLSGVYFLYMMYLSGDLSLENWNHLNSSEVTPETKLKLTSSFLKIDIFLGWTYILTGLTIVLTLVLTIINMIRNPKNIMKMLVSLGLLVIVVVVACLVASPFIPAGAIDEKLLPSSDSIVKWIDAGLIIAYVLTTVPILAIMAGGIMNFIKKR